MLCIAAGLLACGPALAASEPLPAQRAVSTVGVDFQDPAAAQAFYARLRAAADAVCDGYAVNSRVSQADVACADREVAKAVRTLNAPQLTALYARASR
jgi:UrcA family protein